MSEIARKPHYPVGEILIDPTPAQVSDALSKGLNPDAGRALLSIASQGKLSQTTSELVDRAWQQLANEVGVEDILMIEGHNPDKLPSACGMNQVVTFRDKI